MGSRPPGLLLLLTGLLLIWRCANGESSFTINTVGLTIQPQSKVESGTPVTIHCQVAVSVSNLSHISHLFKITLDDVPVYTFNTTEDSVVYELRSARAADSGSYECRVTVKDKSKTSLQKLEVTGLQTPTLYLNKTTFYESEEFIATCSAQEEKGPLIFYFYQRFRDGEPQRVKRVPSNENFSKTTLSLHRRGDFLLSCDYEISLVSGTRRSNSSKEVQVLVKVLNITPVINIMHSTVYEGEVVEVHCRVVENVLKNIEVFLLWRGAILKRDTVSTLVHRFTAQAGNSGELVCKAEWGNVQKENSKTLTIKEIFSNPHLTVKPADLFEGDRFELSCFISIYAPELINVNMTRYHYYKDGKKLNSSDTYSSVGHPENNGNYSCSVLAYSSKYGPFQKDSLKLSIRAKVHVSEPVLSVVGGTVWIGRRFQLLCHSDRGTLPITYVLSGPGSLREERVVNMFGEKAIFNVPPIFKTSDLGKFQCHARNSQNKLPKTGSGEKLGRTTSIIEPLSKPVLTVRPSEGSVSEGQTVNLICSVQRGSPPINFTWYHTETGDTLAFLSTSEQAGSYSIRDVKGKDEGRYYCESTNAADETKKSNSVRITVNLAGWKKAIIAVLCLLVLLTLILVVAFKTRLLHCRKKRTISVRSRLSVKSVGTKAERLSLTQAEVIEVANATPSMMGKSVWSDNTSGSESDYQNGTVVPETEEPQYTEVRPRDPDQKRASVKEGPDTVYSELRHSQQGVPEVTDGVTVEYAQLNHDNGQHTDIGNQGDNGAKGDHVAETDNGVSTDAGDQGEGTCGAAPDC